MSFNQGLHWGMGYHLVAKKRKREPKVICSECGKVYPAKLDKCPRCGAINKDKNQPAYWIT